MPIWFALDPDNAAAVEKLITNSLNDSVQNGRNELRLEAAESVSGKVRLLENADGEGLANGVLLLLWQERITVLTETSWVHNVHSLSPPLFIHELTPNTSRFLFFAEPLRAWQEASVCEGSMQVFHLLDECDKTCGRVLVIRLWYPGKDKCVLGFTFQRLRGFEKQASDCESTLTQWQKLLEPLGFNVVAEILSMPRQPDYSPHIKANMPVHTAALNMIVCEVTKARGQELGIIEDIDTEYLHQYRVSLRKVRSVLGQMAPAFSKAQASELKRRLSAIMTKTGRLRDLDVFLLQKKTFESMVAPGLHDGLAAFFTRLNRERGQSQRRLAKYLGSPGYRTDIEMLSHMFESDVLLPGKHGNTAFLAFGKMRITGSYRKICKLAAAITPDTPEDRVHDLRKECKKLRYLLEFFSPVCRGDVSVLVKVLKGLQGVLGDFNDCCVQLAFLSSFSTDNGAEKRAIEALGHAVDMRKHEYRSRISEGFAVFGSEKTKNRFEKLFGKN